MSRFFQVFIIVICVFMWPFFVFAGSQYTRPSNSTDIITNIRSYLNEPDEGFWKDSELMVWINDALFDIAARTRAMQTSENATLVDNTIEYKLSTEFIGVNGVQYTNGTSRFAGLEQANPFDEDKGIGSASEGDIPAYWAEYGNAVWVWPVGTVSSGEKIIVYLVKKPQEISNGDYLPTPAIYDKAVTLYAVAQALLKDGQFSKALNIITRYEAELDRFRADYVEFTSTPSAGTE